MTRDSGSENDSSKTKPDISIQIDKQHAVATKSPMTGSEIRQLHNPPISNDRDLYLKVPGPGDDRKIGDAEAVNLKDGMHFFSVPRQINPGNAKDHSNTGGAASGAPQSSEPARYTGLLLESDVLWLDEKAYKWTVTSDGSGGDLLVIADYPLGVGRYNRPTTDLLIRIPRGYNDATLDMWWVFPALLLSGSGAHPPAATSYETYLGRTWQRFSRHLPGTWRAGIDDLPRYLAIIASELQQGALAA